MINAYPVRFERPVVDEDTGCVRPIVSEARLEIALSAKSTGRGGERKPAMIELTIWSDDGKYVLAAPAPVAHEAAGDLCNILSALMPQHVERSTEPAAS